MIGMVRLWLPMGVILDQDTNLVGLMLKVKIYISVLSDGHTIEIGFLN